MAGKQSAIELGNLVCRFGDHKTLLDLAEEIVFPAFFDGELVRSYDKTSYFFYQVSLVRLEDDEDMPVVGIAGRYIKNTTLEREQIFEEGKGLVKDEEAIRSSPSALFLLILNSHRLVYVKETKDASSKDSFKSTLLSFLRDKHDKHVQREYSESEKKRRENPEFPKRTKKSIREGVPKPTLELIPLTSEDSIEQFIRKYDVLKSIEIAFSNRNDETDNDPFFEQLQQALIITPATTVTPPPGSDRAAWADAFVAAAVAAAGAPD